MDMSGKDESIRIVIRTENPKRERHDEDDESKREYRRVEFHMVELKGEGEEEIELHRNWLPSLLSRTGSGVMLALGQSIFIVGGISYSIEESLKSLKPPPQRRHLYYKGATKINLLDQQQMWDPFPHSNQSLVGACVPLLGKLYNFGTWIIFPQVFDPSGGGHWKDLPLPQHLDPNSKRSIPVVADPSNSRILVHLSSGLHAFYPEDNNDFEGGKWECFDANISFWPEGVVLASDDLLFFHDFYPASLVAYDLATRNFLDVVWSTPFLGNDHLQADFQFDALFSLPNQLMCFAYFAPSFSSVHFLKFRAERCPDRPTAVILTHLSLHIKTLPDTNQVCDFLPLC